MADPIEVVSLDSLTVTPASNLDDLSEEAFWYCGGTKKDERRGVMKKLPAHIEHWSDERSLGNGIIVTLAYGWSFEYSGSGFWNHEGVRGFDTVTEARLATRKSEVFPCRCKECLTKKSSP